MSENRLTLTQRFKLSRFFRGEDPVAGPITLDQRRIFILPTRRGLAFVLLIALLLLIAFVYNNNLAYFLGFLLASVFFVTILHSYKSLAGLVVQAGYNPPVFAGEMAGFCFHIENPDLQSRFALELALRESQFLSLKPLETRVVTLNLAAHRRGWMRCGTVTLSSCYPLGLFRAWSPLRYDNPLLVYPRPTNVVAPFPETASGQEPVGKNRRHGDEFYGLKSYQAGDSLRQIHWKSFAKGQGLHSKNYAGAASTDLWLDLETAPGSDIEERLSGMCRWVLEAEQAGLRYGLILPGLRLEPDAGKSHCAKCLQALALF